MRSHFLAALMGSTVVLPLLAAAGFAAARDDSAAEKLGFRLSLQCWTYRQLTLFETIDRAAGMGIKYIEAFPGQKLKPDSKLAVGPGMNEELSGELQKKLAEAGVKMVAMGVMGVPSDEPAARKVFDWAKKMGIEVLVTETVPTAVHDKLCQEYNIKMALHNHPKSWPPEKVLEACKDRCNLIGSCSDTGHWMRAKRVPSATLNMLQGRVMHLHFKDLNEYVTGYDVPWGTGKADVEGMLRELQRQGFHGYFSIEYEHGTLKELDQNLPKCVAYFDEIAAKLVK
jgi:sugar phosphate isomerase/epimerase